jgi:hypothetical protein
VKKGLKSDLNHSYVGVSSEFMSAIWEM